MGYVPRAPPSPTEIMNRILKKAKGVLTFSRVTILLLVSVVQISMALLREFLPIIMDQLRGKLRGFVEGYKRRRTADPSVLGVDVLPEIFGFLDYRDILKARVCRKWKEAATLTLVPPSDEWRCILKGSPNNVDMPQFSVTSPAKYAALSRMREILPGLQQIYLGEFFLDAKDVNAMIMGVPDWAVLQCDGERNRRYLAGEEPRPRLADRELLRPTTRYDVSIVADFRHLRRLHIEGAELNGRYPCLFGFAELRELRIKDCSDLKWDLGMLAGMPRLEVLESTRVGTALGGNLQDLGVLKSTLRELIVGSSEIRGDVMDLADFPELTVLDLGRSANVAVDLTMIRATHFPKVEKLFLPGGFDRIANVSSVIGALHSLAKRKTCPCMARVQLSNDSLDRYAGGGWASPPFSLEVVKAGTRLGWRWTNLDDHRPDSCEINWLDSAPVEGTEEYAEYAKGLEEMKESVKFYTGLFAPPTEAEYRQLCRDAEERRIQENREFHAALESTGLFTSVPAYPGE
ncbi:hypothetical protein ACHAXT_011829 [Thalassiosira profunda]